MRTNQTSYWTAITYTLQISIQRYLRIFFTMIDALFSLLQQLYQYLLTLITSLFGTQPTVQFSKAKGSTTNTEVVIGECIGEGAFSFVYKGCSKDSFKRPMALKKVLIQSTTIASNVQSEINSLQRFMHPNIVELLDFVYTTESSSSGCKVCYMLFPFAERGTLRTILTVQMQQPQQQQQQQQAHSNGPSSTSSLHREEAQDVVCVLRDFMQIIDALAVLHEYPGCPYVHQDIKPENVLIMANGRPVLTDFGSARPALINVDNRSKAMQIADEASEHCTMPYRAPELFDPGPAVGSTLDTRTDIWAAGCLLFAWWYGYSPFECEFVNDNSNGTAAGGRGGGSNTHRMVEVQQCRPVKVVPCSHLRVLAGLPRRDRQNTAVSPSSAAAADDGSNSLTPSSDVIDELVGCMVATDLAARPLVRGIRSLVNMQLATRIKPHIELYSSDCSTAIAHCDNMLSQETV